jgi:hypothetical protein
MRGQPSFDSSDFAKVTSYPKFFFGVAVVIGII